MGRAAQVRREIEFVCAREADYHVMVDLLAAGIATAARHPQRYQAEQYPARQNDGGGAFASSTLDTVNAGPCRQ